MGSAVGRGAASALLVLLMAAGSVLMWIGVPLLWLWIGSQVADSREPSLGVYVLVLAGIVVTMAAVGKVLGTLNRVHMELTGRAPRRREQTVWLKSMRGERAAARQHGVLATVMALSVGVALTVFAIWFFFFAEGGGIK